MIKLIWVPPEELTDDDIKWMIEATKDAFDGTTAVQHAEAASRGDAGVYRIEGDATGVVILSPALNMASTLTITGLAGKGLLRHFDEVHDAILAAAAAAGVSKVNGYALRPGLQKFYRERTRAKLVPMFVEDV